MPDDHTNDIDDKPDKPALHARKKKKKKDHAYVKS